MRIHDLISYIETIAPPQLQESYDNCGLIVGDANQEVNGALLCLDCTEDVVNEAIEKNLNLIIAHHPIIFTGLKKLNGKNYVERTVIKAIKNNIAIYAAHTNYDNIPTGVNAMICNKLNLIKQRILAPKQNTLKKIITFCPVVDADDVRKALANAGAGLIGNYSDCSFNVDGVGTFLAKENANPHVGAVGELHRENETRIEMIFPYFLENTILQALYKAHPYEEVAYDIFTLSNTSNQYGSGMLGELENPVTEQDFLSTLKKTFGVGCIKHTQLLNKNVSKVAVCGGSGSFLLKNAIAAGADIFVTADFKYHEFFDAESKIVIADIGHYESEQFTPQLFYNHIIKNFPTFAAHLSKVNTNPIKYF